MGLNVWFKTELQNIKNTYKTKTRDSEFFVHGREGKGERYLEILPKNK